MQFFIMWTSTICQVDALSDGMMWFESWTPLTRCSNSQPLRGWKVSESRLRTSRTNNKHLGIDSIYYNCSALVEAFSNQLVGQSNFTNQITREEMFSVATIFLSNFLTSFCGSHVLGPDFLHKRINTEIAHISRSKQKDGVTCCWIACFGRFAQMPSYLPLSRVKKQSWTLGIQGPRHYDPQIDWFMEIYYLDNSAKTAIIPPLVNSKHISKLKRREPAFSFLCSAETQITRRSVPSPWKQVAASSFSKSEYSRLSRLEFEADFISLPQTKRNLIRRPWIHAQSISKQSCDNWPQGHQLVLKETFQATSKVLPTQYYSIDASQSLS